MYPSKYVFSIFPLLLHYPTIESRLEPDGIFGTACAIDVFNVWLVYTFASSLACHQIIMYVGCRLDLSHYTARCSRELVSFPVG
jgi:hypothetical protein